MPCNPLKQKIIRLALLAAKLTSISVGCWLLSVISFSAWGAERPPNIVLVLVDDQGWNGTSVQMDPNVPGSKSDFYQTPRLEELASRGMRFSNGYSAASVCSPTRASIETGKSPAQLGITDLPKSQPGFDPRWNDLYINLPLTPPLPTTLDPNSLTLPRIIKQSNPNYATALVGKWHLGVPYSVTPITAGYDYWTDPFDPADSVDPWGMQQLSDITNNFMEQNVNEGKPFFVQLSHHGIHPPIRARSEIVEKYASLTPGKIHKDPGYAASTEDLDTSFGKVMDKIRDLGIEDNTYVIYVSDNGSSIPYSVNTPLRFGKSTLWEGGIRIPFIIKGPGIEAGAVSNVPVLTTDLYSTIAELTGHIGALPDGIEGASLVPILNNSGQLPTGTDHLVRQFHDGGELYFHWPHNTGIGVNYRVRPVSAIRDGDYKLLLEYGENGNPDLITMYNLATDLSEKTNLVVSMPAKAAELKSKLLNYLSTVDASLPYDVKAPVSILWSADRSSEDNTTWRSVTDLNYRARETWDLGAGNEQPHLKSIVAFQPNLSKQAFNFDGDDVMRRKFFHVGDSDFRRNTINAGTPDFDRSASIELWLRLDDLNGNHIIFESGDRSSGISLTMGDANGDGVHNDLRFRILGKNGESLVVTSPIDKFANPNRDFIHLVANFDDRDSSRQAQIYINGSLAGQATGVPGSAHSLEWDHYDMAGLGRAAGTLGSSGGSGDLPFVGGLRGQIAQFRFNNYAVDAGSVQESYNSMVTPVDYRIASITGDAQVPEKRPTNLSLGHSESTNLVIVHERDDVLVSPLQVDAVIKGTTVLSNSGVASPGSLRAGTRFSSYLLQFDPPGSDSSTLETIVGSIDFEEKILAILFEPDSLAATDGLLGSIGNYGSITDRGVSFGSEGFLGVSADRKSLNLGFNIFGDDSLQFRVLTSSPAPADLNGDGLVNSLDLTLWQSSFGESSHGDADGDGDTDGRDLLYWQRQISVPSADFDNNSIVDEHDLATWQISYGLNDDGDANGDGITDGRDFLIWQRQFYQPSADFNRNGGIDEIDLGIWQDTFGTSAEGDADGDGDTDGRDFLFWQRQFTSVSGSFSQSLIVPEPEALMVTVGFIMSLPFICRQIPRKGYRQ